MLHGRRVAPDRVEEVAHHYELFGGVSPITGTHAEAGRRVARAPGGGGSSAAGVCGDAELASAAARHAARDVRGGRAERVGFIAAAHHCYSSCQQYRENVADARAALRQATGGDVNVTYVGAGSIIRCSSRPTRRTCGRRSDGCRCDLRMSARLVFTAHSIPVPMAEASRYRGAARESARPSPSRSA